ncbi:MAG: hypothetical protein K6G55_04565 [Selenomonadaceae bacterium]|nr:hypothetical protein [Selenomonadaceae bacterium]
MKGFKIAIATKDKEPEDLILIGKDVDIQYNHDDSANDEQKIIESVDIFFDTIDDNVRNKSSGMLAKIEIKGVIPRDEPELMRKFLKLSEWARDNSSDTQYRNICIAVKGSDNSFLRVYSIKNVFIVDYREVYVLDGTNGKDRFELYLTQKEDNMDKIEVLKDWPSEWDWARRG